MTSKAAEVAELFCDAQEPTLARLRSRSWRGHGQSEDKVEAMSDEELLAAAWSELPGEMRWSPVDRSYRHKQNGPVSSICEVTVRRLADAGATQREIAAEVGKAQSTVMNFMSKRGIQVRRRKGVPLDTLTPSRLEPLCLDEAEMVAQYQSGWSLKQVALEHRCSDGTVRAVLHRNGVKCRSLSEAQRGRGAFGRVRVRMDEAMVTELRIRGWVHGETWLSLSKEYGISYTACRYAGIGRTWTHVPMPDCCSNEATKVA